MEIEVGDRNWEMGDWRWRLEMANGKWETRDGILETGDVRCGMGGGRWDMKDVGDRRWETRDGDGTWELVLAVKCDIAVHGSL